MRKAQKVLALMLQYDKHRGLWYLRQYDTFLFRSVSVPQTILTALLLQAMAEAHKEEVGNFCLSSALHFCRRCGMSLLLSHS